MKNTVCHKSTPNYIGNSIIVLFQGEYWVLELSIKFKPKSHVLGGLCDEDRPELKYFRNPRHHHQPQIRPCLQTSQPRLLSYAIHYVNLG
jgi:hypothetical protein